MAPHRPAGQANGSDVAALVRQFVPGERVFLPGSTGECQPLTSALSAPDAPPLAITATFIPGINRVPATGLSPGSTFTNLFAQPSAPEALARGGYAQLPLSYSAFVKYLAEQATFDTCIVHVAPPGPDGRCSLGTAVEFTPIAAARSRRRVAIINPRMPSLPGAASMPLADFECVVACDAPLPTYDVGPPTVEAGRIAAHVAGFVGDGCVLQVGLGKAPDALLRRLVDRRGLRLFSGMISDGVMALSAAGALDLDYVHTCCVHLGTPEYYAWLDGRPEFAVRDCSHTHAACVLSALPRFVAVNSALTVDLFGQANLEELDGRMISGAGGAPDFARGAAQSAGGISIVALPSTSRRGDVSRIVLRLDGLCSIPRHDIDVIVTEHGAADLRGHTVLERARRLIAIAAPQHRSTLAETFDALAKRL